MDGGGLGNGGVIGFFGGFLFEMFNGSQGSFGGKIDGLAQGYISGFGEPVGFDGGLREALAAVKGGLFIGHGCKTIDGGRKAREVEELRDKRVYRANA